MFSTMDQMTMCNVPGDVPPCSGLDFSQLIVLVGPAIKLCYHQLDVVSYKDCGAPCTTTERQRRAGEHSVTCRAAVSSDRDRFSSVVHGNQTRTNHGGTTFLPRNTSLCDVL